MTSLLQPEPHRAADRPRGDVFVLSGGAARGAVQVGMVGALLDAGIRPAALVGTSVGALNAAYVAGHATLDGVAALEERWERLTRRDVFPGGTLGRLGHLARHHASLYSADGLARLVRDWLPAPRVEDLPLPLRVVTTHLDTGAAVYHRRGPLAELLLASAALPAIFDPVVLRDTETGAHAAHVDGGVADLVPVTGVVDLASDPVGGVVPRRVFVLDASVPVRPVPSRSPIHVLVACLGVAMRVRALPDLGPDVEVHHLRAPDLGTRMVDFSRTREHVALGRRAVERLLVTADVAA